MKHFTSVHDVSDINALVEKALSYKNDPLKDRNLGSGKRIGLLFMNPSMRTRISTQVAAANLGMEVIVFNIDKEGWKLELEDGAVMNGTSVEHIKDAAPVFGTYFDIICVRTFPSLIAATCTETVCTRSFAPTAENSSDYTTTWFGSRLRPNSPT